MDDPTHIYIPMRMVIAACLPMGTKAHPRTVMALAISRVIQDHKSYRAAAAEVGTDHKAVQRWVSEYETRLNYAKAALPEGLQWPEPQSP